MKYYVLLLFILLSFTTKNSIFDSRLQSIDRTEYNLQQQIKKKATVFIFLLADCPACRSYTLTLNQLYQKHKKDTVDFIGIFPGKFATEEEMKAFRKEYKIPFPLLVDPEMQFTNNIGATVVPEVFLTDGSGKIIYSGRIDDWMYALGKKRPMIRSHDLANAIENFLQHKEIKIKKTTAIGCIL